MGGLDDYIGQVFRKLSSNISYDRTQSSKARGIDFRYAFGTGNSNAGRLDVGVFAYRPDGGSTAYHFVTLTRAGSGIGPFQAMVESMRRLTPAEATASKPLRVRVVRVKAGDTPQSLARQMAFPDNQLERFLTLNALRQEDRLAIGSRVKVIVR